MVKQQKRKHVLQKMEIGNEKNNDNGAGARLVSSDGDELTTRGIGSTRSMVSEMKLLPRSDKPNGADFIIAMMIVRSPAGVAVSGQITQSMGTSTD